MDVEEEEQEVQNKKGGRRSSVPKPKSENQVQSAVRSKIESEPPKQEEFENQLVVKSDKKKLK